MDNQHEDVQIRASLETLAHQVSENLHVQLRGLRAALDRQLASVEAALEEAGHTATVEAAVKHLSHASAERANHARKQAEAAAAQALGAIESELRARLTSEIANSTSLRAALDAAKKDVDSAQNRAARAEAAQRAAEAQHGETLDEHKKLTSSLEGAQAQVAELHIKLKSAQRDIETKTATLSAVERQVHEMSVERADLMERIKTLSAAKAAAEAQCHQLESVSQKLSGALSQMLREREPGRPAAPAATQVISPHKEFAKPAPVKVAPAVKTVPPPPPSPPAPVEPAIVAKKPLQFSEKARDAKRVKVRRGIDVNVDGIPGELVDLSIGGAQAILRQAVKPNQLIRLVVPTATGQLICKGRIVWVVYEQPGTSLSVYRTGVKFTDIDEPAVENFMNDYSEKAPMQRQHSSDVA